MENPKSGKWVGRTAKAGQFLMPIEQLGCSVHHLLKERVQPAFHAGLVPELSSLQWEAAHPLARLNTPGIRAFAQGDPVFSKSMQCVHSQGYAFELGDHGDRAAVAMGFDDQIHRQVQLVLKLDFATNFAHESEVVRLYVQVHITAPCLVIDP